MRTPLYVGNRMRNIAARIRGRCVARVVLKEISRCARQMRWRGGTHVASALGRCKGALRRLVNGGVFDRVPLTCAVQV